MNVLEIDIQVDEPYKIRREGFINQHHVIYNKAKRIIIKTKVDYSNATLKTSDLREILKFYGKSKTFNNEEGRVVLFSGDYFNYQSIFKDIIIYTPKGIKGKDYKVKFMANDIDAITYILRPYNNFDTRWELIKEGEESNRLAKVKEKQGFNVLAEFTFYVRLDPPVLAVILTLISFVACRVFDE